MRPELRGLQKWVQEAIVSEQPADERAVSRRIKPSHSLTAAKRLDVYRDMYEGRLNEALRGDYPGLVDFLGERKFDELVHLYIQSHPSRSYTLNRLGDRLPEFLGEVEGLRRERFVCDLARLELARTLVFDDAETPSIGARGLAAIPCESWSKVWLRPIAAFRLLALDYPVHRYLDTLRKDEPRPSLRRKKTYLAIYRRDYALGTIELTAASHRVLFELAGGATLGEAIAKLSRLNERDLFAWFQEWSSAGLFQEVKA
jgi:hypothetical protein